eukprot:6953546-Alexandrium_andersonii.AAC.1
MADAYQQVGAGLRDTPVTESCGGAAGITLTSPMAAGHTAGSAVDRHLAQEEEDQGAVRQGSWRRCA